MSSTPSVVLRAVLSRGLRYEDKFPPDCPKGKRCFECKKCYSLYVEEKMAGLLD